ncbi:septal ring lytic transglycosylase RlpA family protein [Pseudolabrys sp. FHR47]|uniref:septal ring lytic transglycosylase RlpA family protein n=1 Tax=Pseudolabrys sp. FHR47 TaxID=2562284 RepID=UPI001FED6EF0|nr:septal ring lytic transglycosylase RlpA family protein [Pseudolabrys sp. FHR47]
MSVCDLDPTIARMNGRMRGKAAATLAIGFALAAVDPVDATIRITETATVAVAIPQSCDKDVGSGGPSLAFRFGAPAIPAIQSVNVTTPAPSPSMETTGSVPPMHNEMPTPQRQEIVASGATIIGIASTYDPGDPTDLDAGNEETASGERYDADDWTAAIQIDLRDRFGGVRYGRNYQPAYALVEAGDKRLVVRINDVGPLKPGRVIDLNVRAMRYFDPSMQIGLIADVKVSPLLGEDYALGPVTGPMPVTVASRELDVVAGP